MRHSILITSLAASAYASSGFIQKDGDCVNPCLTYDAAHQVATNFGQLISQYSSDLAERTLTSDFTDSSDSVNTLINYGCTAPKPLGSVTFTNRQAFMAAQSSQPAVPWELLNLWYACQGPVVMRWRSAQTPQPIVGNIVVEVQRNYGGQEPWLMKTLFSEFNSGAWLVNQGTFKGSNCSASAAPGAQGAAAAAAAPSSAVAPAGGAPAAAVPATSGPPAGTGGPSAGAAPSGPPSGAASAGGPPAGAAPSGPPAGAAAGPPAQGPPAQGPPAQGPPTQNAGPPTFGAAAGTGSVFGGAPTAFTGPGGA